MAEELSAQDRRDAVELAEVIIRTVTDRRIKPSIILHTFAYHTGMIFAALPAEIREEAVLVAANAIRSATQLHVLDDAQPRDGGRA
jgi:hypothetical protein